MTSTDDLESVEQSIAAKVEEFRRKMAENKIQQTRKKTTKLLKQVSKIAVNNEEATQVDFRKLSFFMGDEQVVKSVGMYYCTEHGKVMGCLQISQSRIFFDPTKNCEENKNLGNLRQFEVCIDMGDVISVQKKTLINESGEYVADPDGRKSYMFDFFLQVDLASVNRKKTFNTNPDQEEESKEELDGDRKMQPSFINTHLGASMQLQDSNKDDANVRQFLKSQALDEISKARPVATVFFRFSHRSEQNKFLRIT